MTLAAFLAPYQSFGSWHEQWDGVPLEFNAYLAGELPPREFVGSVRAIVFRGEEVLVVQSESPGPVVGGRCEPSETIEQTLLREVGEETGWQVSPIAVIGFRHIRHIDEQRPTWGRPWPAFIDPLFAVKAERFEPALLGLHETRCEFLPIGAVEGIGLDDINLTFFREAVRKAANDC